MGEPPAHMRADSVEHAGRWLDAKLAGAPIPRLLLVIGLGEGHLLDLLEQRAPETRVLALEPDPGIAKAFLRRRDWAEWLESGRLIYLIDPDYSGSDEAWRIFPPGSDAHTFLVHPSVEGNVSPGAIRAAKVMKDILFGVRANAEARRRFAPRYLVNTLRNLPAVTAGSDVRALTGVFKGLPAVVAGAGPSLDRAIAALRGLPDRAVIFATDTAMRPMLHAGLSPPFTVGLDPSPSNARHFHSLPDPDDVWLISESALDETAAAPFGDRTFWFRVSSHHPWPWYNELGVDIGRIDVWGSVLTGAFQVAVLAGCDPIVLVGADLSFTNDRPYCRGTTYEFTWTQAIATGKDLHQVWKEQMERAADRTEAVDLHGGKVNTTRTLQSFRDWLVSRAARSGRRVINATGAGILFGEGIEQRALADVLTTPIRIPPVSTISRVPPSRVSPSALATAARSTRAQLDEGTQDAEPLVEWREFCGEAYDPTAIGAALDAAAEGLESTRNFASPPDIAALKPVAGLVGLPERDGVLRAVSSGQPIPEWVRSEAVYGSVSGGRANPFADAGATLARLFEAEGAPLDGLAQLTGLDVKARWGTAVLDQRFEWTAGLWRNLLWDYHDALAIGIVSGAAWPPGGELAEALSARFPHLVAAIAGEPRVCEYDDVQGFNTLLRESVCGYNVLGTPTGCVAASHELGPMSLRDASGSAIEEAAHSGRLLWAPSEADAVARIERYVRQILLLALARDWIVVRAQCLRTGSAGGDRALDNAFQTLLQRAAGVETPTATLGAAADRIVLAIAE